MKYLKKIENFDKGNLLIENVNYHNRRSFMRIILKNIY